MQRRRFLTVVGGAAAAFGTAELLGASQSGDGDVAADSAVDDETSSYTVRSGTRQATEVFVRKSTRDGPTALVVGGMHGDETSGYRAASDVARWPLESGTLVAIPRANRVAIRNDRREGARGDLNRQFPTGERPTTALARAIWSAVQRHDPDVVLDLHSSVGIYRLHEDSVGQTLWPTDDGTAATYADRTVAYLNDAVVPWSMPYHDFRVGGALTGDRPMLAHKVAGDLDRPGYIIETTDFLLDGATQVRWTRKAAADLLARHGVVPAGERGER